MSATTSYACDIASRAGDGVSFDAGIGELQRSPGRSGCNAQYVGSNNATGKRAAGRDASAGV